jgi:hypothetical protein
MPPFSSLLKILEHPAAQTGNATECAPRTPVTLFGACDTTAKSTGLLTS